MEIERLRWSGESLAKLLAHGIDLHAVEDMIFDVDQWVVDVHGDYPIGPTSSGRFITVALDRTESPVVWRPVTGWPSIPGEIAYHREENR